MTYEDKMKARNFLAEELAEISIRLEEISERVYNELGGTHNIKICMEEIAVGVMDMADDIKFTLP